MKKFLIALVILIIFNSIISYAEEFSEEAFESMIEISVNAENKEVVFRGEQVLCEPPYVKNGVTMIAVNVITDAFGAEIVIENEIAAISYAGVAMKYTNGSFEAAIDSQILTMPESAEIVNGTLMVPLRFLSESFGADVVYDSETKNILITGTTEGVGLEGDFKLLLKYGNKSKIGNSKEGWRFSKPADFDMQRSYYGNSYIFAVEDVYFEFQASKNKDKITIDQLYISMQAMTIPSYYFEGVNTGVLIEKHKGTRSGLPYVSMKMRTTEYLTQMCAFLTDKYIYTFEIDIPYENYYADTKESPTIDSILDSFEVNFSGGDDDTIDLEAKDEKKGKIEEYTDGNYSWTIKPYEDWEVQGYDGFYNKVNITRESKIIPEDEEEEYDPYLYDILGYDYESKVQDAVLNISIYSNPDGQSITDWVDEKYEIEKDSLNSDYLTVSSVTDTTVGEIAAKSFSKESKYEKYTWCQKYYYLYYNSYRYILVLNYDKRDGEESGFLNTALSMIDTFTPADISLNDIGGALERDNYLVTDKITKTYDGKYMSFTLPYLWNARDYSDGEQLSIFDGGSGYYSYSSANNLTIQRLYLDMIDEKGELYIKSLEEYVIEELIAIRNVDVRRIKVVKPVTKTTFKDREAYTYIVGSEQDGKIIATSEIIYVKGNDNDCFVIARTNTDMYKGTRSDKIHESILSSLEFK